MDGSWWRVDLDARHYMSTVRYQRQTSLLDFVACSSHLSIEYILEIHRTNETPASAMDAHDTLTCVLNPTLTKLTDRDSFTNQKRGVLSCRMTTKEILTDYSRVDSCTLDQDMIMLHISLSIYPIIL